FIVFLGLYSILLIPLFLAVFHVVVANAQLSKKILNYARKPALIIIGLLILGLGLVPNYTRDYPQVVTVREEWSGKTNGTVHIFSDERLPRRLVQALDGQAGKSQFVPILNEVSPISIETSLVERQLASRRELAFAFSFNHTSEPYLIRFKLESDHPFEIQTADFLPMAKLPKKVELKGVRQPSGKYTIVLQKTPPHKKIVNLAVETEGIITCTVEAICPDRSPRIQINNPLLSVDYEIQYNKIDSF
ncbi:MAG: Zn-dependent exopeptidase M28, partial [Syntrophomonadaceae bacterium]|nr:Zn-dependent exopeptidase M28 [Syntrophomonadaceae bacterium]